MLICSRLLPALALLLAAGLAVAVDFRHDVLRHQTRLSQANWTSQDDARSCALVHAIENYGLARFEQRVGEALTFQVSSQLPQQIDARGQLLIIPSQWQPRGEPMTLAEIEVASGHQPVSVDNAIARRMVDAFISGQAGSVRFPAQHELGPTRELVILPVHFRAALEEFDHCRGRLASAATAPEVSPDLPRDAPDAYASVFFATDSDELTASAIERLDQAAEAFLQRSAGARIQLLGHADPRGSLAYNRRLAERRLFAVRFHLVTRGVPLELINAEAVMPTVAEVEAMADETPSEQALAQGRRVDVVFR